MVGGKAQFKSHRRGPSNFFSRLQHKEPRRAESLLQATTNKNPGSL